MRYQVRNYYKKAKKKSSPRQNNTSLRNEIYGLILFAIGVMAFLAILTYHQTDPVGHLARENVYKVKNLLGIAGATFAYYIFQWSFGYPSLVFPIIIVILSIALLVRHPLQKLFRSILLLIIWSYLISVALALPSSLKSMGHLLEYYPSGFLGGITASFLVVFLGKFAAVFVWFISLLVLFIITFHLRFSTVPLFIFQSIFWFIRFLKSLLVSISLHIVGFFKKALSFLKRRPRPASVDKRSGPEVVSQQDMGFATEEKVVTPDGREKRDRLEIVSHQSEATQARQPTPKVHLESQICSNPPEISDMDVKTGEQLSFSEDLQIEEAVRERELDYDTLVRNSLAKYQFPSTDLLQEDMAEVRIPREELMANARLLERTLGQFGVKAYVRRVVEGPVITLYAVQPAEGVKINQIVGLTDDLALALRAKAIRMIAPIPGEAAIGIEIPNHRPSIVYFKSIVRSEKFIHAKGQLILGMGKTISGEVHCMDLVQLPHLLMAGTTGSGKSVAINTMIASILYRVPPSDVKFVLIDPKKLELSLYAKLKDHYLAICPDLNEIVITHPQNAILMLSSVVNEMEERYDKLAHLGVRDIVAFNQKVEKYRQAGEKSEKYRKLPYIVIIIDELADLILSASREVEEPITRLAQMARAVGIHLIVATQRPSVDILTGLIKANFPARIAFQVATRPDSKVILDLYGAEKLIGNGDMLFLHPGTGKPIRLQSPLITTDEIERIIKHVRKQPKFPPYELKLVRTRSTVGPASIKAFERDKLFEEAKAIVIRHNQGSISLLQRKLKIGYARAARLIDQLEEEGIVGPEQGSKARDVLVSSYTQETDEER